MSERYNAPVEEGLLYYTQSEEVISVPAAKHEIRALIRVRNDIAEAMVRRFRKKSSVDEVSSGWNSPREVDEPFLPETIDDERICGRCYALDACMLYRKVSSEHQVVMPSMYLLTLGTYQAVDNVEDTTSLIADIYQMKTGHLSPHQLAFFKDWERLISIEEHDMVRFRKELWTVGAREREQKGRCFANMMLKSTPTTSMPSLQSFKRESDRTRRARGIHQFTYSFCRRKAGSVDSSDAADDTLLSGHLGVGDAIAISVDPDLISLSRGFILDLSPDEVIVGVDHEIDPSTLGDRLSTRRSIREGRKKGQNAVDIVFRIDKDELSGGMGRIRENLAQLFYVDGDRKRLKVIVDLDTPRFDDPSVSAPLLEEARNNRVCKSLLHSLNNSQVKAIERTFCAQDYSLILGMPGTGRQRL